MANLPPVFSYKGNQERAKSLRNEANQFYNYYVTQAEVGNLRRLSRYKILNDGSVISINTDLTSIYNHRVGTITITGANIPPLIVKSKGYMESGILDLVNRAVHSKDTYYPCSIRLTDYVNSKMNSKPSYLNASLSRIIKDKDDSWSTGCKSKVKEINVVDIFGDVVDHFISTTPAFCDESTLQKRKLIIQTISPSLFTGRTRDYIQALYGSDRNDFDINLVDFALKLEIGKKEVDGEEVVEYLSLYPRSIAGYGIYELPDNKFAIILINGNTVTARLLIPVLPLIDMVQPYSKNKKVDKKIIDIYNFATLKIDNKEILLGTIPDAIIKYASPIAYGWHFNNSGTKAIIAGRYLTTTSGLTREGVPSGVASWDCALIEMDINLVLKNGVLSGSISTNITEGPVSFIPNNQTAIYSPDYTVGGMMIWNTSDEVFADTLPAPIYAYYDKSDNKVVIKANGSGYSYENSYTRPTYPGSVAGSIWDTFETGSHFSKDSYHIDYDTSRSQTYTSPGGMISVDNTTYSGSDEFSVFKQSINGDLTGTLYTPGSPTGNDLGIIDGTVHYTEDTGIVYNLFAFDPAVSILHSVTISNSSHRTVPFLVIPYADSQSIFAGTSSVVTGEITARTSASLGQTVYYRVNGDFTNQPTLSFSGSVFSTVVEWPNDTAFDSPKAYGNLFNYRSTFVNGITLVGSDGNLIPRIGVINFNPLTENLNTNFIIRQSVGGSYNYNIHPYFIKYSDWPSDLKLDGGPIGYA